MCNKLFQGRAVVQLILLLIMMAIGRLGMAQDTITISFGCAQVAVGDQICVPVYVDNFTNVTVFSLLLTWDPLILQFTGLQNEAFPLQGAWNAPGPSDLRYIWNDPNGNGQDLPDGSILYEMCFRAIGPPGSSSIIEIPPFVLNPFNTTEFADPNVDLIPYVEVPCTVEVINPVTVIALIDACGSSDGIANGSFTITAAGGTAPYMYTWSGPQSGNSVLGSAGSSESQSVPPGNYTITITDDLGGSQMYMITIAASTLTPVITLVREITCFNFSNGRIEVGAFNGVHPISILWQNLTNLPYHGSGFLRNDGDVYLLNSLPVGQYVITLIDDAGCVTSDTIVLSASPIVINAVTTNATCLGTTDGSVQISFSGGRPYQGGIYEITPGWGGGTFMNTSPIQSAPVFGPGDYWVEVCDSINNCCVRDTFTVGADVIISAAFLPQPPPCTGINDARLRVTGLTDGAIVGPYSIQLFNANHVAVQPPINNVMLVQFNNLVPGNYFVVVKEGMCRSDTMAVTLPDATPINIQLLSVTPSGCVIGQNSGSISVDATGGTPGYMYAWDGGALMGKIINNVSSGNHFLTVTDANGCTRTMTVNVPMATGPMIDDIVATNVGCTGDDITLEVVFTEGSTPVTRIQWSNGDTTAIITGVGSGQITVTIRDSLFCFDIASFDVPAMAMIVIDSLNIEHPTCGGDSDGQIAVFVSDGTPPYTYYWSNGDTTTFNLLAGLGAGSYSVTIVDSDTCDIQIDTTILLMDPPIPTFAFSAVDSTTCFDVCDGSATLTPANGVPGFPYSFMWDSGHMSNGMQSTAPDLCPGFQRVIITQDNLCFYEDSVFIPAPDPVEIDTVALQDVTCFGASDGLISINGTGGSGGYTYVWTVPGVGPMQSGIPAGAYGVTVTDAAGCTAEHLLSISEPDSLVVQIDTLALRPITCNFANSGSISLSVAGGTGGYLFNWNPNVSSDFIANGIAAGLYEITVTDAAGCTDTTSILMTGPEPVVSFLPIIDGAVCFGGLAEVTVDSAVGGNGGYTWSVNGGQPHGLDSIVLLPAGIYNIITQDSTGCRDTIQIILDNPPPLEITIVPANPVIDLGDSVRLEVSIVGNLTSIDSVSWSQVGVLNCYDCTDPRAMNVVPTVYTVTVWDDNGCTAQLDVLVDVDNHREVFIPNVFSPNFDGRNDQLLLFTGQGITSIPSIRIFDRWGELMQERLTVFPADGGIEVWDGSFHGKMMAPGVYVYVIEVRFADNQTLTYRGDVTLLR